MSEMFNHPRAHNRLRSQYDDCRGFLELSSKNWRLGAVAPCLSRRMKRSFEARNVEAVVRALEQAKGASAKAHFEVTRFVVGSESRRDGFLDCPRPATARARSLCHARRQHRRGAARQTRKN